MPDFPCTADMWDTLARESRPIVVYGMGNGADKLAARFEKYGIAIADFFASDGFVRGHSFRGKRVLSFSEVKERYTDFVIVLSFASNKPDVLDMLWEMSQEYEMYVPDMPIADEGEYFDREFYNAHYHELLEALDALADADSKSLFCATVNYKLTGRAEYLFSSSSTLDELYSLLPTDKIRTVVDVGAYNGDTLSQAIEYFPYLAEAIAIEPDPKTFGRLEKFILNKASVPVRAVNAAAWSYDGVGSFSASGNRNSTATATVSYEHKDTEIPFVTVDSLVTGSVDYIKYDVEGAESEALLGSHKTVVEQSPALLISLYHRSRDLFSIINTMKEKYSGYSLYLRRLYCVPAWELDLIALPQKDL